jgi:hypothetical protein
MPGYYGDTVVELIRKAISRVVDKDDVLKVPARKNPQILYVNIVNHNSAVSVQAMVNQVSVWVQVVEYGIGVALM